MSKLVNLFYLREAQPGQGPGPSNEPGIPQAFIKKEPDKAPPGHVKKASGGPPTGLKLSGGEWDPATLEALLTALQAVRTRDDDLAEWVDDVVRAIGQGLKTKGDVSIPKYEATPSLDSFDDDAGGSDDEDF